MRLSERFKKYIFSTEVPLEERRFMLVAAIALVSIFGVSLSVVSAMKETTLLLWLALGFVLVLVLLKSGSLWPCIGFHMLNNALSFFESEAATIAFYGSVERAFVIGIGTSVLVAVLYIIWLLRLPDAEFAEH